MEVRGTPSYLGHHHHHHHNRDSSSSKISPSTPPTTTTTTTVHDHGVGDAIFSLSQTLDHHHHRQSNVNPVQDTHDNIPRRSRRDPDTDPDPVPATASIATTSSTDRSTPTSATTTTATWVIRYRECLKNHAASMGRHVVDGCGEFMPGVVGGGGGGEEEAEGNSEALKCAACECHRNFHRKEINGHGASSQSQLLLYQPAKSYYNNKKYHHHRHNHNHHHHHHQQQQQQQPPPPLPPPATFYDHHNNNNNNSRLALGLTNSTTPAAPLMMVFGGGGAAAEYSSSGDLNMFNSNAGGQSTVLMQPKYSKKRFRTKFSQEQKEKMMELAEKIGWRIQKQDEKEVQEFCAQVGVKRQVFKVWMHNNKQASVKNKE